MSYLEQRRAFIEAGRPLKEKKRTPIKKISDKLAAKLKKEKEDRGDNDTELQRWYKMQMKYMNVCEETGMKLETKRYRYAIMSICHILPKSTCPSVATHPLNKVFLLPDLHTKFDASSWKERETWSCWPDIQNRLVMLYPDLAPEEHRHFPESVLKYIENNKPF